MADLPAKVRKLVEAANRSLEGRMGSPKRPGAKGRARKGRGSSSSSAAAAAADRTRMSEREEDAMLLQEEGEEVVTRLTAQPANIKFGTLREYQMEGLNWLIQLYHKKLSGILADEMGLGKTLQSISLLAYLRQFCGVKGPHLVVVPLTTLGNWMREFERWCPEIRVLRFYGNKEERAAMVRDDLVVGRFDVCCTSFETAIKEKGRLKRFQWNTIVVDEAHRLKNESSVLSQVMRLFPSRFRLLLTGTPLQNNLHELWALLNFLLPETFGSSEEFDATFAGGEEGDDDVQSDVLGLLHRILRPFMLRRLKHDVEKTLLPKVETLVLVGMSAIQKEVYRRVLTRDMDVVMGQAKERSRLLNILMQLRKAANHPYLFDGVEDRSLPPEECEHLVENSGKLHVLDKLLTRLKKAGSRVLIFSQMTRMLDILEDYMAYRGHTYCRIDGSTSPTEREEQMERYNAPDSDLFCFLLSTRAGGLGINLYTADIVVLYDSDWNPQMDLQAQDRAHRIGQKKQVQVYRFVTEHSIEEKIIERAEIKLRLDALVIQQGRLASKSANKLGQKEMQAMIRYGADQIFRSKDSSITDEDIDLILSRGQQRTAEMTEKLQKHVGMAATLALDGKDADNLYTLDGFMSRTGEGGEGDEDEDEEERQREEELRRQLELVNSLSRGLAKRERKTTGYNVDAYYREAMNAPRNARCKIPRPMKPVVAKDYQFFNVERIRKLCEKEARFFERYKYSESPPATSGLSEAEQAERRQLLAEGFPTWKRRHLSYYLQACERFGRGNVAQISQHVPGQAPEEVARYHEVFWKRLGEVDGHKRYLKAVERGEQKLVNNQRLFDTLQAAMSRYASLEEATSQLPKALPYTTAAKRAGFKPPEDVFLLWETARLGYGAWDELRQSIHAHEAFYFDYFLKTRTPANLRSRVDVLIRAIEKMTAKEAKRLEKEAAKRGGVAAAAKKKRKEPAAAGVAAPAKKARK